MSYADQSSYRIRFDWGLSGLEAVGHGCGAIVVVDVLSFCTCVSIAVARGAEVLPYRYRDASAGEFARARQAVLADERRTVDGLSLSPSSLLNIPAGTRFVLPSPNGATLALRAGEFAPTGAGALRNARAIGRWANSQPDAIAVIACGERWNDDKLRPAWEDLIGAGAIVTELAGSMSPEAETAAAAFRAARPDLGERLRDCASGRELIERGFANDVDLAAQLNADDWAPVLRNNAFRSN